jgi:manganese transport system permease protein
MNLLAVASAMLATALGILASYWLDASTAGCIVLVQSALFVSALVLAPRHGLLARRRRLGRPGSPPP